MAEGVVVLNPADYTAMGFSNNKLTDPEIFIPLYLRNKLPYILGGAQEYLGPITAERPTFSFFPVLSGLAAMVLIGNRTFQKKDNVWSFFKYVRKAIFSGCGRAEIIRDRIYQLAQENICTAPVSKGGKYG